MILRKPIFWPALNTKTEETTIISRNGAHQLALRRRSVNVFDGAIKVSTMRAPSESGAGAGTREEETGGSGATAIITSTKSRQNSIPLPPPTQACRASHH